MPFTPASASGSPSRIQRHLMGCLMEPISRRFLPSPRACLPRQNEKRRLIGILSVMPVVENALARAQDHGAMALHQDCKGSLIVPLSEALEQLPIRQVGTVM